MLSKTSNMFQENTIIYMISDLSTSMDEVDSVEWLGYGKQGLRNFKAKFYYCDKGIKEAIEVEVKDNDWLNLDIENYKEDWSLGFSFGRKFSDHLQLEVDYLRKRLERWDEENEAKLKLGEKW